MNVKKGRTVLTAFFSLFFSERKLDNGLDRIVWIWEIEENKGEEFSSFLHEPFCYFYRTSAEFSFFLELYFRKKNSFMGTN